jgi:2-methylisocitrate lyase-like PEP mutase family enzyme
VKVNTRKIFRELLRGDEIIVAPGASDAFIGRIIEQVGFKAIYIGGSNIHAIMGHADGESTMTEYMAHVKEIAEAVQTPLVVDMDTGFGTGSAIDLMRTVRECERLGAAAVHTEDQVTTKRIFAYNGPELISREEMLKKIEAALEAREDKDLVFIARTDARSGYGLEETLERAKAYARAGADMVAMPGLESVDELKRAVDTVGVPLMIFNGAMKPGDSGNKLTFLTAAELQKIGVKMVTFGNGVTRLIGKAVKDLMEEIKRTGTDNAFVDRMLTKGELQALNGMPARDALRKKFNS